MIAAAFMDRARLALALLALALIVGAVLRIAALDGALTRERAALAEERGRVATLEGALAGEVRASQAFDAALGAMRDREARVQPIIIEAREAVANAPDTTHCVGSPAIDAALAGVMRLQAANGGGTGSPNPARTPKGLP